MDNDILQSLLYGQLEVEVLNPTFLEQLELVRAIVSNPSALRRLRIVGETHPWVAQVLKRAQIHYNDHLPPS